MSVELDIVILMVVVYESSCVTLLPVVKNGMSRCTSGSVVNDCLQKGFVQLSLIIAAEQEEDIGAQA